MVWHPMVKVAEELGICVNTFKKYYLKNILQNVFSVTARNGRTQHWK